MSMNKKAVFVLFCLLSGCHADQSPVDSAGTLEAKSSEPPLRCEFSRGDWCLLKKGYLAKASQAEQGNYHVYWIAEDYWANEAGVVLEGPACGHGLAPNVTIGRQEPHFKWENVEWRMVELNFGSPSGCTLKLLAPLKRAAPLDMAASVLSTNVAYCDRVKECQPKLVADAIHGAFQQMSESTN